MIAPSSTPVGEAAYTTWQITKLKVRKHTYTKPHVVRRIEDVVGVAVNHVTETCVFPLFCGWEFLTWENIGA